MWTFRPLPARSDDGQSQGIRDIGGFFAKRFSSGIAEEGGGTEAVQEGPSLGQPVRSRGADSSRRVRAEAARPRSGPTPRPRCKALSARSWESGTRSRRVSLLQALQAFQLPDQKKTPKDPKYGEPPFQRRPRRKVWSGRVGSPEWNERIKSGGWSLTGDTSAPKDLTLKDSENILFADGTSQAYVKGSPEWREALAKPGARRVGFDVQAGSTSDLGLGTKGKNTLQTSLIDGQASIDRFKSIGESFDPKFLEKGEQGMNFLRGWGEKLGMNIGKSGRNALEQYTTFRQKTMENLNLYIKEITGAQVSEHEAVRLMQALPNLNDSPTEFRAKMRSVVRTMDAAQVRARAALEKGIVNPGEMGALENFMKPEAPEQGAAVEEEDPGVIQSVTDAVQDKVSGIARFFGGGKAPPDGNTIPTGKLSPVGMLAGADAPSAGLTGPSAPAAPPPLPEPAVSAGLKEPPAPAAAAPDYTSMDRAGLMKVNPATLDDAGLAAYLAALRAQTGG